MGTPVLGNVSVLKITPLLPTPGSIIDISDNTTDIKYTNSFSTQKAAHRGAPAATVPGEQTVEIETGLILTSESGAAYKVPALQATPTGTKVTALFQPEGPVTGAPAITFPAWVTDNSITSPVGNVATGNLKLSAAGAVTFGAVA